MNNYLSGCVRILCITLLSAGLLFLSCICSSPQAPVFDDPSDPDGTGYIPPGVIFTGGPADSAVVNADTVHFTWTGSEGYISLFSYSLDSAAWTPFSGNTSVIFRDLGEGEHLFMLQSSYGNGNNSEIPAVVRFIINNIQGPALLFNPTAVTVSRNDSFSVDIIADDVSALMSVNAELAYKEVNLEIIRVEKGPFLDKSGGYVWLDTLTHKTDSLTIASTTLKTDPGQPGGVNGTGVIARVLFKALQIGNVSISFTDSCSFRSLDYNEDIILNTRNTLDVTINQ